MKLITKGHPWSFNGDDTRTKITLWLPFHRVRGRRGSGQLSIGIVLPSRVEPRFHAWTTKEIIYFRFGKWRMPRRPAPQRAPLARPQEDAR